MTTSLAGKPTAASDRPVTRGRPATLALARAMGRLASGRVWVISAAIFAPCAAILFGSTASFSIPTVVAACDQAPPDVRFTSSAAEVAGFLDQCDVAGRQAYQAMQVADVFYPLVFAVFMAASLAMVITRLAPGRPLLVALAALPLVASAFDYLENLCAWMALAAYPEPAATNSVLGLASAAKTTTSWLAGILLLSALTALIVTTIVRRVRPAPHGVPTHDTAQVR